MHLTRSTTTLIHTGNITRWIGHATDNASLLHICLDSGLSANYKPHTLALTLVERSVSFKTTTCLELLIQYHADINCNDGAPIGFAVCRNRLDVVDVLIKAGVDVNLHGRYLSIMSYAFMYASHTIVTRLLSAGATLPSNALKLVYKTKISKQLKIDFLRAGNKG